MGGDGEGGGIGRGHPFEVVPPVDGEAISAGERPSLDITLEIVGRGRSELIGAEDDHIIGADHGIDGASDLFTL